MPYLNIPVETARKIARDFDKQIVIILAWNHKHGLLHTVTYGEQPADKISAAKAGEIATASLGMDLTQKDTVEDFRTVDAARNAQFRDMAERLLLVLRSYECGNLNPGDTRNAADDLEKLIKNDRGNR